jgi:hypothetical protein
LPGDLYLQWLESRYNACRTVRNISTGDGAMNTGKIVWTWGIRNRVASDKEFAKFLSASFKRYLRQDWGEISQEDKQVNDKAMVEGTRILASYNYNLDKLWIITEADRSSTCFLFPDEY